MAAVALIGPDGAGKTTVTRMLQDSGLLPFRYLYMGVAIPGSNVALPTSRLAEHVKRRRDGGGNAEPGGSPRAAGLLWRIARLGNRIADAWFRQFVSWYYQVRGFTVLYDRHFVFDFAPEITGNQAASWDRRLYHWLLLHFFPRPDLVLFLDAPGQLLFERKGELTVAELERRRQAFLRMAPRFRNFIRVDATRPLSDVYAEVAAHVVRFCQAGQQDAPSLQETAR